MADPTRIDPALDELRVAIDTLKPYPQNPRRGSIDLIRKSLEQHGQYRPIVARSSTGEVLAGNHTLLAARELGWTEIAVAQVDVDEEQAARILLIDNRTSDLASWDSMSLAELLGSLPDLDGTGFDQPDLDALLARLAEPDAPAAFPDPESGMETTYECPSCGYAWSGLAKQNAE